MMASIRNSIALRSYKCWLDEKKYFRNFAGSISCLYILIQCVCVLRQHDIVDSCSACDYYKPPDCTLANCSRTSFVQIIVSAWKNYTAVISMNFSQFFFRSFLQFEKVIFNSNLSVQHTCRSSHIPIICKFTKHNRSSIIQLVEENTEKNPNRCLQNSRW